MRGNKNGGLFSIKIFYCCLIALIAVILIFSVNISDVHAEEYYQVEEAGLSPEFIEWQKHPESHDGGYIPFHLDLSYLAENPPDENYRRDGDIVVNDVRDIVIPSAYDLRTNGKVTSVKSQGQYGSCWAFASLGAMESNLLMQGKSAMDLSEMHLHWFTFKNTDKAKAFYNLNSASFATVMDHGGNTYQPAAMYSRLEGPASEADVPFGTQPSQPAPADYERVLRLKEVFFLSMYDKVNVNSNTQQRDIVKKRIMENGSVVASYTNDYSLYKKGTNGTAFYKPNTSSTTHAIQIIGWDDNYSASNFENTPSMDGAWLIKNSWGTNWGDSGYFWMSYEQYLTDGAAFVVEEANSDMRVYYYDALGWTGGLNYGKPEIYGANVFKSERSGEYVTEIGFYTPDNNINYEISVYTGLGTSQPSSPVSGGTAAATASGRIPYAGYHTVVLDSPAALTEGEYFSVVMKLSRTSSASTLGFPSETVTSTIAPNARIETGSFFSSNGTSWYANSTYNACIKAFTVTDIPETAPTITTSYPAEPVANVKYSSSIAASGTRPMTWTLTSGNLPTGLSLNSSTGEISGTPTVAGENCTFTITVTNTYGSDNKTFTVNVLSIPSITTTEFTGYLGYDFSGTLKLSENVDAEWSISTGTLPTGLSLNEKTGVISGRPKKTGTYTVRFIASVSAGNTASEVTFTINAKPVKPKITVSSLAQGTVGEELTRTITFSGTEPVTLAITGLPNGLNANASGSITGTPTEDGTFVLKVSATNIVTTLSGSGAVTKNVKLVIKDKAPSIKDPGTLANGIVDEKYNDVQFETTTGTGDIDWKASGLPKGMTLSATGLLSGTPTKAGIFNINLKISNSGGKASLKVPLTVLQKPDIATTKLNEGKTDKAYNAKIAAKGSYPISWDISGLPETLSFTQNTTGNNVIITGTPTEIGNYNVILTAANSAGVVSESLTLKINGVAPKIKASLAKGEVENAYTGSSISATGTKPINITYSISDADKTKFGIESLEDLGLTFTADAEEGTAAITGTPTLSVKALPIVFSAVNAATTTPVTKKVSLTIKGDKPVFISPNAGDTSVISEVNSNVEFNFEVKGTPNITFSMNNVSGFTIEQTGDYTAKVSGTAPSKIGKTTITVTAKNNDGKAAFKTVIQTKAAEAVAEAPAESKTETETETQKTEIFDEKKSDEKSESEIKSEKEPEKTESENQETESSIIFGSERGVLSLSENEILIIESEDCIAAAVLPEIKAEASRMYDIEVELYEEIETGAKLCWFAFPQNREPSEDDEIVEFYDTDGAEITDVPENHKIIISVWLNENVIYKPVIAVKK